MDNYPNLILLNSNYFDSINGKMISGMDIEVANGKISKISDTIEVDQNKQIIDLKGKFVLPGLIDCHVHLESQMAINYERQLLRTKSSKYGYIALKNAQEHLLAGFTTLRDCGSFEKWAPSLREILKERLFFGPRLLVATLPITQYGDQEAIGPNDWIDAEEKYTTLSGLDGIIHAVRNRKRAGSDFIKSMTTGGVLHGVESKLERSLWRDDELDMLVSEAHRLGLHVAIHAHGREGIYRAAKSKVDTIEHGSFIDKEIAEIMKTNGTYLIPTQTSAFIDKPDLMANLPPEVVEKTTEVDLAMFKNHKIAFESGVKIALGTDAGVPGNPHGTSAREMTSYVNKIGMSPVQALQSGTIEAAKAIKLSDSIGSIEKGKVADLIVVNSNPLEDISLLEKRENINFVIKDGIIMVKDGKLAI